MLRDYLGARQRTTACTPAHNVRFAYSDYAAINYWGVLRARCTKYGTIRRKIGVRSLARAHKGVVRRWLPAALCCQHTRRVDCVTQVHSLCSAWFVSQVLLLGLIESRHELCFPAAQCTFCSLALSLSHSLCTLCAQSFSSPLIIYSRHQRCVYMPAYFIAP